VVGRHGLAAGAAADRLARAVGVLELQQEQQPRVVLLEAARVKALDADRVGFARPQSGENVCGKRALFFSVSL